jgi:hypothetical protein
MGWWSSIEYYAPYQEKITVFLLLLSVPDIFPPKNLGTKVCKRSLFHWGLNVRGHNDQGRNNLNTPGPFRYEMYGGRKEVGIYHTGSYRTDIKRTGRSIQGHILLVADCHRDHKEGGYTCMLVGNL